MSPAGLQSLRSRLPTGVAAARICRILRRRVQICRIARSRIDRFFMKKVHGRTVGVLARRMNTILRPTSPVTFADFAKVCKEKPNMVASKTLMQLVMYRIHRAMQKHGVALELHEQVENFNVRKVLASFMMVQYPNNCFEIIGRSEQAVLNAATMLNSTVLSILDALTTQPANQVDWMAYRPLFAQLHAYIEVFEQWRQTDQAMISARFTNSLMAMYTTRARITDTTPRGDVLMATLNSEIVKLTDKLRELVGTEGVAVFHAEVIAAGFTPYTESPTIGSAAVAPPANDGPSSSSILVPAAPMSKAQLAHELTLDPSFRMSEPSDDDEDSLGPVSRPMKEAFWSYMKDELRMTTPRFSAVTKILSDLVANLVTFNPDRAAEIRELVDLDHFRGVVRSDCVHLDYLDTVIGNTFDMVALVVRPASAEKVRQAKAEWTSNAAGATPQDRLIMVADALRFLVNSSKQERLDRSNDEIAVIAHVFSVHGIQYARSALSRTLRENPGYLDSTKEWLRGAVKELVNADKLQALKQGDTELNMQVFSEAIFRIVTAGTLVSPNGCPAVLSNDIARLNRFKKEFIFDATAAAMLYMLPQRLGTADPRARDLLDHIRASINQFDSSRCAKELAKDKFIVELDEGLTPEQKDFVSSCTGKVYSVDTLRALFIVPRTLIAMMEKPAENQWRAIVLNGATTPIDNNARSVFDRIQRNAKVLAKVIDINSKVYSEYLHDMLPRLANEINSI